MRRTLLVIFALLSSLTLTGYTAYQQAIEYNADVGAICAKDRTVPTPTCIAIGIVDSIHHVIAMAGGIDVAAAVCDGTTDDKSAIETAASALSAKGGTIRLPPGKLCYVSGLTLPANVTLDGGNRLPDNPYGSNSSAAYASLGGIALSSSGTISLGANSAVQNLFIKRAGMTFPAADTSAFAGTAITFAGADSARVSDVMALGFNTCIAETGTSVSRYRIEGFNCDGINGEMITLPSWDSSVIRDVHNWPFSAQPYTTCAALLRSGHGLHLAGAQDDTRVDNVLSLGYNRGFWMGNTGSISMGKIWADYPAGCSVGSGSAGVWVDANVTGVAIDQLWSWASEQGVVMSMTDGAKLKVNYLHVEGTPSEAFSIIGGDLFVANSTFRNIGAHTYNIGSATSKVYSRGTAQAIGASALVAAPSGGDSNILDIKFQSDIPAGGALFGSNTIQPSIAASGTTLQIRQEWQDVTVTGTSVISTITSPWGGRRLMLRFVDAAVIDQTGNVVLATPVFQAASGRYVSLVYDSGLSKWVETARGPTPAVITDLSASTTSPVAASTTVYLGANGAQSTATASRWVASRTYSAVALTVASDAAPGASQTYTYTLYKNGSATSVTGTISGASSTSASTTSTFTASAGDTLSIQLVTSSGATATNHRVAVELSY